MSDNEIRPEETEPHLHPCPRCEELMECWCPFPERDFKDLFAVCHECACKKE